MALARPWGAPREGYPVIHTLTFLFFLAVISPTRLFSIFVAPRIRYLVSS